ncbi:hypothetical protein P8452_65703 [Trifolium repens]|nr:hypothetical protein P8452_65703 [Trifolium repens]
MLAVVQENVRKAFEEAKRLAEEEAELARRASEAEIKRLADQEAMKILVERAVRIAEVETQKLAEAQEMGPQQERFSNPSFSVLSQSLISLRSPGLKFTYNKYMNDLGSSNIVLYKLRPYPSPLLERVLSIRSCSQVYILEKLKGCSTSFSLWVLASYLLWLEMAQRIFFTKQFS